LDHLTDNDQVNKIYLIFSRPTIVINEKVFNKHINPYYYTQPKILFLTFLN